MNEKNMQNNITPKKHKRKVRKSFLAVVLVFVISILVILSTTVLFPVSLVKVEYKGTQYTKTDIANTSKIVSGDNLIMLSKKDVEQRITEGLPYIESVSVKKQFPGTVVLKPTETTACYCIKHGTKFFILDKYFKVLEQEREVNTKLIYINGMSMTKSTVGMAAEFKDEDLRNYIEKITKAAEQNNYRINYIDVSNSSNLNYIIDERFNIKFGSFNDFAEKVAFLNRMVKQIESKNKNDQGTINLSYFSKKKEGYFTRGEVKIKYPQ